MRETDREGRVDSGVGADRGCLLGLIQSTLLFCMFPLLMRSESLES